MNSSRPRGFTILETAAAIALSSIILVSLVLWVSTLLRSTTTAIELAASNRQASAISLRLEQDVLAMVSCSLDGTAPSVVEFTPASLGFFADVVDASGVPGRDGSADFVRWSFADPLLTRAVVPGTGSCPSTIPVPASSLILSTSVSLIGTNPMFVAYAGTEQLATEEDCLPVSQFCRPTSLRVRMVVDDNDQPGSAPASLNFSFNLSHIDTRL